VEIVVTGRRTEVPERFRRHVTEKLAKVQRLDERITGVIVEVTHEPNPRRADEAERIEITVRSKGPVIRAEAAAADRYGALDLAMDRLEGRLRRAADRRRDHRGRAPVRAVAAAPAVEPVGVVLTEDAPMEESDEVLVVREKVHEAVPMTMDQALYEMELVGHDFFLFVDADSGRPSVVYRRRGYDYGVIRLAV
jgi:ribosomal subunit interface protein